MAVHESIVTKLSAVGSATAAILGTADACKVYPELAPQNAEAPYVIVNEIASSMVPTHGEVMGVHHALIQFSCYAATYVGARDLREAIISDLDNIALSNGDKPTLQDKRSGYESAVDLFRADADFLI